MKDNSVIINILKQSERDLKIRNDISNVFLTISDENMYFEVLKIILDVMQSQFGVFGYIDENLALVIPSMTRHIWDKCQVKEKTFIFPKESWGNSIWPRAIKQKQILYSNEPSSLTPKGHIQITRNISAPIIYHDQVIGLIQVANKPSKYTDEDINLMKKICDHIAPVLNARLQRDIQEKKTKQFQEALQDSEEIYKSIINIIPIAIIRIDQNNLIKDWNTSAENIFKWKKEEVLHKDLFQLINDKNEISIFESQLRTARLNKNQEPFIAQNRDKMGKRIYCEWFNCSFLTSQKKEVGILLIASDITEKRRMEEILRRTQKMDAIGQLTEGIAHDFNNILNVINGFAEIARSEIKNNNILCDPLDQILKNTKRGGNLIHQLLSFSKKQEISKKPIDINLVISDLTSSILQPLIGKTINISLNLGEKIHSILADPTQIEQILINLCVNARDAINDPSNTQVEKTISIRTANVCIDSNFVKRLYGRYLGNHVIIEVSDTGTGMDSETKQHLFEPFFSTKPSGKGTGLGLATVYGIIQQNNASIYVYSEKGKGTTFKIYWPAIDNSSKVQENLSKKVDFKTGTVIIAEDDPDFRKLMSLSLQSKGFTIIECSDGQEVMEKVRDANFPIDLIISDVFMPRMTGIELAKELQNMKKSIKILFISGFENIIDDPRLIDKEKPNFLSKPFSIIELQNKIQDLM